MQKTVQVVLLKCLNPFYSVNFGHIFQEGLTWSSIVLQSLVLSKMNILNKLNLFCVSYIFWTMLCNFILYRFDLFNGRVWFSKKKNVNALKGCVMFCFIHLKKKRSFWRGSFPFFTFLFLFMSQNGKSSFQKSIISESYTHEHLFLDAQETLAWSIQPTHLHHPLMSPNLTRWI